MSHEAIPTFGHLMCELGRRVSGPWHDDAGVARSKMTIEECGIQCRFWADAYPALADDLTAVAVRYQIMADRQKPVVMREPGDERLEDI